LYITKGQRDLGLRACKNLLKMSSGMIRKEIERPNNKLTRALSRVLMVLILVAYLERRLKINIVAGKTRPSGFGKLQFILNLFRSEHPFQLIIISFQFNHHHVQIIILVTQRVTWPQSEKLGF
jgi:hypothetical protein